MCVCVRGGQLFFEADDFWRSVCVWGGGSYSLRQTTFVDLCVCVCGGGAVIL